MELKKLRPTRREILRNAALAGETPASLLAAEGESRAAAQALAHELARFPQGCMRADRRSVWLQEGLSEAQGLRAEWACSAGMVAQEGAAGAARFAAGRGRHGDFADI